MLTGLITGCVTFFVFIFAFGESGEQKITEIEEDSKPFKEIALETNELNLKSANEVAFPTIIVDDLFESLNTNSDLSKAYSLTDLEENQTEPEILESEEKLSEFEKEFYKIAKNKGVNFLKSLEYGFIQKAVAELKKGKDIDYNLIKSQIRHKWSFSTNQLFKFVSAEMDRQSLGYSFVQELSSKQNDFVNNSSYKYIKQFAKKYGEKGKTEDFNQLHILLKNWQFEFSIEELKNLVSEEYKRQRLENLKSKILKDNPHNRGAILKVYLNFNRSNDEINLRTLVELLEERYSTKEDISTLKTELQTIEKRIELENFEKRLLEEDEQIQLEEIDNLNGYEFEDFLKNLFSKMGYQVEQTRLSGDQGADLVVVKFGKKTVIQAKRFGGKVGNKAVQEIMAAISLYQAQNGMVITNSYFTPAAVELANANNIELVDRNALEELLNKHW